MYSFETSRLRGISDMIIENGKLICANKPNDNIFIIKQSTGKESGFVFYDKRDSNNIYICHIGITRKRGRTEVTYGTEQEYRGNGFMQEALNGLLQWIKANTLENKIWGIPNGEISEHILKKCGFEYYGKDEENSCKWFVYIIER